MQQLIVPTIDGDSRLQNLLAALGVDYQQIALDGLRSGGKIQSGSLILSEKELVSLCNAAFSKNCSFGELVPGFSSVLIYPFECTTEGLRVLSGTVQARISPVSPSGNTLYQAIESRELCGPFSGLTIAGVCSADDVALRVTEATSAVTAIVCGSGGNLLTKFRIPGIDLFVASSKAVFDPSAMHVRNLDVRECFSGLVPLLFFLRHCSIALPRNPLRWANWIIDDPGLKPRYGFLNMKELHKCIGEIGAAATIAFIPWNHTRTSPEIVGMFRRAWPQLSICIHGCDHTGSEFSTTTSREAWSLVELAMTRMKTMQKETSLPFERVMVFPQGRFSAAAMRALRSSEMLAAVNTELLDCQTGEGVRGGELLRPAITSFGGFPLFMRRRADAPLADFALDLILNKPCLIVTHHQYFDQGLEPLRSTVESLNALEPEMVWTSLEKGISSTCSIRKISESASRVRLYNSRTTLSAIPNEDIYFRKGETDPETVDVFVQSQPQTFRYSNGDLEFSIKVTSNDALTVELPCAPPREFQQSQQSRKYRLKATARRYLCDIRDNYLSRLPRLTGRTRLPPPAGNS